MRLDQLFSRIYVINKKDDVERKIKVQKELGNTYFEFFEAIVPDGLEMPKRAIVGNRLSHLEIKTQSCYDLQKIYSMIIRYRFLKSTYRF